MSSTPTKKGPQNNPMPASITSKAKIEAYGTLVQHESTKIIVKSSDKVIVK